MSDGDFIDRGANVLFVEDEPLVSDIVAEALVEQGFTVRTVDNARDALACLSSGSAVDILFTDLNLAAHWPSVRVSCDPICRWSILPVGCRRSIACSA
jgi:CheY-like chemotaxis protein